MIKRIDSVRKWKLWSACLTGMLTIVVPSVVFCQSASFDNFSNNIHRYIPYASIEELVPTGDQQQFIYSGSNIRIYGLEWSVTALFNIRDGNLDHLSQMMILPYDQSESYNLVLSQLKRKGFRFFDATEEYQDIMSSIVGGGMTMMSVMTTFKDAKFMVNQFSEPELIKLVGMDNRGICWIVKFPKTSLPKNFKLPYENIKAKSKSKKLN